MSVALVALQTIPAHCELASSAYNLGTATDLLNHDATIWTRLGCEDHVQVITNSF